MSEEKQEKNETTQKKKTEFVLVKNGLEYIFGTGVRYREVLTEEQKEAGMVARLKTKHLVLYPGWNSVKRDLWEESAKNKMIDEHIDMGNIQFKDTDISKLKEDSALRVVREINDPRYLKILTKTERRTRVQAAAAEQLDDIVNPKYEEDE